MQRPLSAKKPVVRISFHDYIKQKMQSRRRMRNISLNSGRITKNRIDDIHPSTHKQSRSESHDMSKFFGHRSEYHCQD